MRCLPGPRPRRVVGVAEVIRVRRLAHPALLARGLARSPTRFLCTVTLALPIAGIGHEKPFAMRTLTLTGRMHGAGQPRRPATPRQTHRPTLHSVHEGRKSTRTEEDVSYGIRKKILGKNREFQTAGRRWVSDRCWQRKNDQAWIEQKNGAIVRKTVGDQRYEGIAAAQCLAGVYTALRFFVNFFQPSFKLAAKTREGSTAKRSYHAPATPCERLLSHPAIGDATKTRLREVAAMLDPIRLLEEIRNGQSQLTALADGRGLEPPKAGDPDLSRFLSTLATAWQHGEVRATHAADAAPMYTRTTIPDKRSVATGATRPTLPPSPSGEPAQVQHVAISTGTSPRKAPTPTLPVKVEQDLRPPGQFVRPRKRMHAFVTVWPHVTRWLEACPNLNAAMILEQLQALYPGRYYPHQESSLHRRVRAWREVAVARGVVIGPRMYRIAPTRVWRRTRKSCVRQVQQKGIDGMMVW